jgi:UDP-GlcNAc:undecaprenyl-phosphate GlcNAc-1-phosphate transferase
MYIFFFIIFNFFLVVNFKHIKIFHINIDKPDKKRKFHKKPTPLAGGVLIFINILIYTFFSLFFSDILDQKIFLNFKNFLNFIIIASIIFLIGFYDDKLNIRSNIKFFLLIIVIFFLLQLDENFIISQLNFSFSNAKINLNEYSIPFTIFAYLVFLNAFNMFDGINLQSGIYSFIILISISILYVESNFIKILIISLLSFLYLNYKDLSFLGDSGTLLISFIISCIFILLYNLKKITYADDIAIFMLIPGLDLIRLFITRIINKKNPLNPDRNHLHHLLLKKYSEQKSLIIITTLIILPILLNMFKFKNLISLILVIVLYSVFCFKKKLFKFL